MPRKGTEHHTNAATPGSSELRGGGRWADPASGISFAFVTNTFAEPRKQRVVELATLAGQCALGPEQHTVARRQAAGQPPLARL